MFTKNHCLGFGPSITMLLGNIHGPLRGDEAEPEQETRKYKPVRSKQGFLAELGISFAYFVESILLICSWCIQSIRCPELSSRLNTLFLHILQCCVFTYTHRTFLMRNVWLNVSTKEVFCKLPLLPNSLGGPWEKSCSPSFRVYFPIWDLKTEQQQQMGGTNRAFKNLEGTFVSNSAFKRGERPRAFALFIPTHFPILTGGSNKSGPCRVLQMD